MYNYSITEKKIVLATFAEKLFQENKLSEYPKWATVIKEDNDIFDSNCKCGIFEEEWSWISKRLFQYVIQLYVNNFLLLFHPSFPFFYCSSSISSIGNQDMCLVSMAILDFATPFLMVVCVFNLIVLSKLISKKGSTVFQFQFYQNLAALCYLFIDNDWVVFTIRALITWPGMNPLTSCVHEVFLIWFHLISEIIILDRCFAVYKPVLYKKHGNSKNAILLIFILLFASFVICSYRLFTTLNPYIKYYGDLFIGILAFLILPLHIIMTYKFVSRLNVQTAGSTNSRLAKNQRSINKIIVGHSFVDFCTTLVYCTKKLCRFYNYIVGITSDTPTVKVVGLVSNIFMVFSSFISLILSIVFSQQYRDALVSLFCCRSIKIHNVTSVVPMRDIDERTSRTEKVFKNEVSLF